MRTDPTAVSRFAWMLAAFAVVAMPSQLSGQRIREARGNVSVHTTHEVRLDSQDDAVSADAKRAIVAAAGRTAMVVAAVGGAAGLYAGLHSPRVGTGIGFPASAIWGYTIGFGLGAAIGAHEQAEHAGSLAKEIALNLAISVAGVQLARATNSLVPLLLTMPLQAIIPTAIEVHALARNP